MARKLIINHIGVAEILKSPAMQNVIREASDAVAENVRSQNIKVQNAGDLNVPVEVNMTTTDRAHGFVSITHPAGLAVQAKYGALTKAAAQAGLDVTERSA